MGLFNFNKKKKFLSKLSSDQRDEITITLILMKQMIDADGVDKPEEKEYYKKYLINCGISSKEELESILDRAGNLTSDQYDTIVHDFDEFQKLTILQELYGIICSDNEINQDELDLLFHISRDMGIDDDIIVDMLGAKRDLLEKFNEQTKQNLNNIKEKIVSSNKKLRDELNKFNLTEIKSFSVDILFDKWSFFEEINYTGNFKGFDFTLNGGTAIKWSKHKGCYKDDIDAFLNDINSKEISELDFQSLNYECDDSDEDYDYNFFNKIVWGENTPEEIIKDVEKNYSENEYEKLRDEVELEEEFLDIELFQKKGFINQIDINITFENETKNLKWIKKEDDSKEEIPENAKKINNEKDLIQELGKLDPEEYKKKAFDLWRYFFLKNYDESEEKDGWEIGQEVNSVMFDMYEVDFVSFFHNHKDSGDTETMGIRFPFKYLENGKPALIYNFPFKYDKITTHSSGSFYQLDDVWGSLNEVCKSLSELEVIDFEKLSQNEKIKMFKPKRDDYS